MEVWGVVWDRMFELFQVLFQGWKQGQDSPNYLKSGFSQLMSLWEKDPSGRYCWEFGVQNMQ